MHGWCQTAMLKEGIVSVTRQLKNKPDVNFYCNGLHKKYQSVIFTFLDIAFNLCQLLINNIL